MFIGSPLFWVLEVMLMWLVGVITDIKRDKDNDNNE
jgi:hypothetical protein